MSTDPQVSQTQPSDKEINFRKQEQMYKNMLAEKESRIAELERIRSQPQSDDDDGDEPYIDRKKLGKALSKERETIKQETQSDIQRAVHTAIAEERRQAWLKANPDFSQIMSHAERFAEADPELAETILSMPDTFERQKLVYKNIKALGIHQPPKPQSTIQDTIDKNRRSPYYSPSGVGSAPYASSGDFSKSGQENAYKKLLELKNNLRLG